MAHFRRAVGAALVLNTSLCAVEMAAGIQAQSLSLLTDSIHNCSDELALGCLYLAFYLPGYLGRHSQRTANLLNSLGLIVLSAFMIGQAVLRLMHPTPMQAFVPIVIGLAAAAGNYGVAVLLRKPAQHNAAVRLAYLHNRGDVLVSLAPVCAGTLVAMTHRPEVDVLMAGAIALWLIVTTVLEVRSSGDDLLWPAELVCAHPEAEALFLNSPRMPHSQLTTRNRAGCLSVALASILTVTLGARGALGFICIETSHGQCIHWAQHAATLRSFLGNLGDDNAINAANDWSSAGANFRFTVTVGGQFVDPCGPEGAHHVCPNTGPAGDNPIVVASTFCGQGFGDIIELTNDCWTASTGAILNAPVFVNDTLLLDVYDGPLRFADGQPVYDIRRVLLHEFGHVLGLDHPNDHGQTVAAIMNGHFSDLDRLQTDDINGIFSQYGGPTPSGCAGDCNGNANVRIDELITLADIALGNLPLSACAAGEPESVSEITVSDVIVALNSALTGCVK